jgi:hypothetical protein
MPSSIRETVAVRLLIKKDVSSRCQLRYRATWSLLSLLGPRCAFQRRGSKLCGPAWLRPRDRWQERAVAAWWLLARTHGDTSGLAELAAAHLGRAEQSILEHTLVVA